MYKIFGSFYETKYQVYDKALDKIGFTIKVLFEKILRLNIKSSMVILTTFINNESDILKRYCNVCVFRLKYT